MTRAAYADALNRFDALVDPKTGVIRSVELVKLSERDPSVFLAHAEPCDTTAIAGMRAANRGAACSPSAERAIVRACGESVERYCSAIYDVRELRLASEEELEREGVRFVPPYAVHPFAERQFDEPGFPYERTAGRTIRWVPGTSLADGGVVLLPASCVYVPHLFDKAVEPFTHMPISTGLAAGPDFASCVRKGMLEVVERDALMIAWHARLALPRIRTASCRGISPLVDRLLDAETAAARCWHLNLLTLDVDVPVVLAALIDDGVPPLTSLGIAADLDPARALLLALEEAALTRVLVNRTVTAEPGEPAELRTLNDHMTAHATSPELRERLRFLTDEGPEIDFGSIPAPADHGDEAVTARLVEAGFDPVAADVTTEDVADFGFRVVRSVVPGMQPLDNDHTHRHLGGRRLLSVPPALGFPALRESDLNPDPHPFP